MTARHTRDGDIALRDALRRVFLFEAMADEHLSMVASVSRFVHGAAGEELFSEGDPATAFHAVISGRVKVYRVTPSGAEMIMHVQKAGDLVAEAAIFSLRRYPANCAALEETTLVRIPAAEFTSLLMRHPELSLAVMHGYSLRLRSFVETIDILSCHDVRVRVARFLVQRMREAPGSPEVPLHGTRRDLASLLGTVPETLSRAMTSLRKAGVIADHPGGVRVLDTSALQRIARGEG